ncbi:UNVERIFIED_CONTAM: hypothetical protein Slati_0123800 [Sesamum latifolium]|uniref:Retrotransposon gag domain-containing protein n=1 Tax=Sesamum latifolium TaxID=2727402 RepID=A0AAW2Y957_9LAMI
MRRKRKSNNRSAPGGRKATEDLKSRKTRSELKAIEDLNSRKTRSELNATEDLESRKSKSEFKATEDLENRRKRAVPPRPPRHPRRGHRVDLAPGNDEQGPADQQSDDQLEEEVESRPSLPEVELPPPPPPPKKAPPEEHRPQKRDQTAARQASIEKTKNAQAFPLAVAPPRRSPLATHVLAEAIQPGIKIPNLSEYNGVGDPQDHLDQFLARADLLDISDAAYCKLFRTTLSGKAMVWFNQLPLGTIETFDQLSQRFLHHFAINKRYPKTASYLFTIVQHEHEGLREYVQRFLEAILEVPHVDRGRRSYAPKAEKGRRERKYMPPNNLAYYTPLSVPRAELLAVAIQQGLVRRPPPMQDNPKRMKSEQFCRFHEDRGHDTEDCYNLRDEIERLVQKGHFREFLIHRGRVNDFQEPR